MTNDAWDADKIHWYELDNNDVKQLIGPYTHGYNEKFLAIKHIYGSCEGTNVNKQAIKKALNRAESSREDVSEAEEVRNSYNEVVFTLTRRIEFNKTVADAMNRWTGGQSLQLYWVHTRIVPDKHPEIRPLGDSLWDTIQPFIKDGVLTLPIGPEIMSFKDEKEAIECASEVLEKSCSPDEQVWGLHNDKDVWMRAVTAGNPTHIKCLVIMTRDKVTKSRRRIE